MKPNLLKVGQTSIMTISRYFLGGKIPKPKLIIINERLAEVGFEPDTLVIIDCQDGIITLTAKDSGIESYRQLVQEVRRNGQKLVQVTQNKNRSQVEIMGDWLSEHGFEMDDIILVRYDYGKIQVKKLDLEQCWS